MRAFICAPVLPEITDRPRNLEALVKAASEVGAKYIYANALFLKPCSAAVVSAISRRTLSLPLSTSTASATRTVRSCPRVIRSDCPALMASLRQKYRIGGEHGRRSQHAHIAPAQTQLQLFEKRWLEVSAVVCLAKRKMPTAQAVGSTRMI